MAANWCFSQEIAIPYRDGQKWGVCNPEAKMLIEPKFDKIDFYTNFSEDYKVLVSSLKKSRGLIIGGIEILQPIYNSIFRKGDLYIADKYENNRKITEVITADGKSILSKPIIEVILNENFDNKFQLFHVLNTDMSESVFIYNSQSNTISKWLYDGYYSLALLRIRDLNQVIFKVKRKENDAVSLETWNFSKLPEEISKSKLAYKTEADLMALFMKESNDRGSGGGEGTMISSYDVVAKGDTDSPLTIDEPVVSDESSQKIKKEPVRMSNRFEIENKKLVLIKQNEYKPNSPKKIVPITLNVPVADMELKSYFNAFKKNDTIYEFKNAVLYKKNNKKGILFSSQTKGLIEFDTIFKVGTYVRDDFDNTKGIYIVGDKAAKTNTYKYSFYSSDQKLLYPVHFDDLKPSILSNSNGIKNYIARVGSKYGLVQNDGIEILKCEYDEIKEFNSSSSNVKIIQTKKDNKYRVITQRYSENLNQKPAVFDYAVKDIILNYPKEYYDNSKNAAETVNLLELFDENKNIMGYANENGTLYFKN